MIGSPLGGELLTFVGTGLAGVTEVTVGGEAATSVRVVSDTELTAVTPPGAGPVDVVLVDPSGATVISGRFAYGDLSFDVLRPDDLLVLRFAFPNGVLEPGDAARVVAAQPGTPLLVVVEFPPQHIVEAHFDGSDGSAPMPPVAVPALMSGPSRLVFTVPADQAAVPLSTAAVLSWAAWTSVLPAANAPPSATETALELPYRLIVTPPAHAQWLHSIDPATVGGSAEVWHSDLQLDGPSPFGIPWCVDFTIGPGLHPLVDPPLGESDRAALAWFGLGHVARLTLSSLGAYADFNADLTESRPGGTPPSQAGPSAADQPDPLTAWRHVVAQGRDQHVRVVHRGYLAPFCVPASLATVTDRRLVADGAGTLQEILVDTEFLIPSAGAVNYTGVAAQALKDGRALPFTSVRLVTRSVPRLDGGAHQLDEHATGVPYVDGSPFLFHLVGTDHAGRDHELVMPLLWVPLTRVGDAATDYDGQTATPAVLSGRRLSFLPNAVLAAADDADTSAATLPTVGMSFDVVVAGSAFLPTMRAAEVNISSLDRLLGSAGGGGAATFGFTEDYLDNADNVGGVYGTFVASLTNSTAAGLDVGVPADRAGGLSAPQLPLDGLSALHGPVIAAEAVAKGLPFDPSQLKLGTLLGVIDLEKLLASIAPSTPDQMPRMLQQRDGDRLRTTFTWSPPVKPGTIAPLVLTADSRLTLRTETLTSLTDPPSATFTVNGSLTAFSLTFLDAITVVFDSLSFSSDNGRKVDVTTGKKVHIEFSGDLDFVNELARLLPTDGFQDPPFVHATPEGVTIGYTLAVPSAGVGILSLENIAISAALDLAFHAPAAVRMSFAERHHPFLVTVSLIAGGGFLAVEADTTGIRRVEAAFELGANLSIDFFIVSANVHVLAGFYFAFGDTGVRFQGYLRVGGAIDLLGIVTVSVELVLTLGYSSDHAAIEGEASVVVAVTVLMVSKSFSLSVHKSFAVPGASAALPSATAGHGTAAASRIGFGQLINPQEWADYGEAFV